MMLLPHHPNILHCPVFRGRSTPGRARAPVRRDAVIIFCITHGMTMAQTEEMLLRKGEGSLFERV